MENLQPTNYCNRYEKVKWTVAGQNHFKERIPREASSRYGRGNTENETRSSQPDRKSLFLFYSLNLVFYMWDCWVIWARWHLRYRPQTFLRCVSYSNEASQSEDVTSACKFYTVQNLWSDCSSQKIKCEENVSYSGRKYSKTRTYSTCRANVKLYKVTVVFLSVTPLQHSTTDTQRTGTVSAVSSDVKLAILNSDLNTP